jgi:hypothetical protein
MGEYGASMADNDHCGRCVQELLRLLRQRGEGSYHGSHNGVRGNRRAVDASEIVWARNALIQVLAERWRRRAMSAANRKVGIGSGERDAAVTHEAAKNMHSIPGTAKGRCIAVVTRSLCRIL